MKIVTFTFPHIYEEFICPCSHIYVHVQHYVHQQFHWSRKCFTFVTDIFPCVQTTPSKSSKASQALIINAERPSCQRLIKSSNQTLASLPNCCSQKSSRTLTCGSFHPDTLDSVLDGLPWYMCSLHWEYLEELNKVHSTRWNILYFFGRVDARSSGRTCFANLGESVLVSPSDQRVEGAPNNLPKMPDWSFS